MDAALKAALGGTAAVVGAAGLNDLRIRAIHQYQQQGMKETGSGLIQPGMDQIINKYAEQTGVKPNVFVNTNPSGASYSAPGKISLNLQKASKFTLGHELGHQSIDVGGGVPEYVQRNLYNGLNPNVVGLATIGVSAMSPSTRRATGLALAMNYLNHSGRLFSELEATRRGTSLLNQAGVPVSGKPGFYQVAGYALAPAATALAGVGVGRFLRAFADKVGTSQAAQAV